MPSFLKPSLNKTLPSSCAGTLDVLFVDQKDPWDPAPDVRERVFKMLDESHRWAQGFRVLHRVPGTSL